MLGVTAAFLLREDPRAIDVDFEDAAAGRNDRQIGDVVLELF